jgi:hypothetical protein
MNVSKGYTQADYEEALEKVKDQEQILRDASANGGTDHVHSHNKAINSARVELKKIRDAMVAAGTLPATTPEVLLKPDASQMDDVFSRHGDK